MKRFLIVISCLISFNLSAWIIFNNALPDILDMQVFLENNTVKKFSLKPFETLTWYGFDSTSDNPHEEIPVTYISAESKSEVIRNWNYNSMPDPNNPHQILAGKPIYGRKKLAELDLNEDFKCTAKFKTKDPALIQYNGMVIQCKESRKEWGLDTSKRPLEIIIIEQRNPKMTLQILESIPKYYKEYVPAGKELGGLELVILAREVKS